MSDIKAIKNSAWQIAGFCVCLFFYISTNGTMQDVISFLTSKQKYELIHVGRWRCCFYLIAELPQAPCLSVRMFTIFWMSCVAVTWSRYLAARIRWSHIFSSSRFSAAYWAQLDWGAAEGKKDALHRLQAERRRKPGCTKQMCQEDRLEKKWIVKCKILAS